MSGTAPSLITPLYGGVCRVQLDKDLCVCEIPGLEAGECHVALQFHTDSNLVLCGNIPHNPIRGGTGAGA